MGRQAVCILDARKKLLMQRITYHVATSVDGFIASSTGSVERFPVTGDHVDEYLAALATYSVVVMGRKTYQLGLDLGVADPYPHLETYVFSRTLTAAPSPRVRVVSGDVAAALRRLREQPGQGIYLAGGGEVAAQALRAGLIDELVLKVNPMAFGQGIPLFGQEAPPASLALRSAKVHDSGVVVARYRVGTVG